MLSDSEWKPVVVALRKLQEELNTPESGSKTIGGELLDACLIFYNSGLRSAELFHDMQLLLKHANVEIPV